MWRCRRLKAMLGGDFELRGRRSCVTPKCTSICNNTRVSSMCYKQVPGYNSVSRDNTVVDGPSCIVFVVDSKRAKAPKRSCLSVFSCRTSGSR
jgi:hypothetical protein